MKLFGLFLIFLSATLFSHAGIAQQITGSLEGKVLNDKNEPLEAVNVTVSGPNLQGTRGAATNQNGYFRILALPVGVYTVRLSHIAFHQVTIENMVIRLGKTTTLGEQQLVPRTIEIDKVIVTSARPQIDPNSTTLGNNLSIDTIDPLPVERNFRSIAALIPQANTSYFGDEINISGSTGLANEYFIDGVKVTDPYRATTSTNLPYNFIKEIEIKTGGYEAEFRSALGGILNVVTHSGGNEFHGQVFGFFTNNHLAQERRLTPGEANIGDFSSVDFGFSLGGPIIRDKLWFFAAYNPNFNKQDIELPSFGFQQDKKNTHIFAGKLTWRAHERTNVVFSLFGDPGTHTRIGPTIDGLPTPTSLDNVDPFLGDWAAGGVNMSLKARQIVTDYFFLEADLTHLYREEKNLAATERGGQEPLFLDIPQATWSGGYGFGFHVRSTRAAAKMAGSLFLGKHTIKGGVEYEEGVMDRKQSGANLIFKNSDSSYVWIENGSVGKVRSRVPSLLLQDSWLISERLRINFGLRWDGLRIIGSDGQHAQSINNQVQPRLGFAFQPGEVGTQKIFGSYGRFYQHLPLFFAAKYMAGFEVITIFDHDPRVDPMGGIDTPASGPRPIPPEVKGLEGQYFDEFTLGYERQILKEYKFGLKGIYRNLGQAVDDGRTPEGNFIIGNPGKGDLAFLPEFNREYTALELSIEKSNSRNFNFLASYVLSRNHGNHEGLFDAPTGLGPIPNSLRTLDVPEQIPNSTGLLPNDRTHNFKFNGSYQFAFGLSVGTSFSVQTGTPLTEYGGTSAALANFSFLTKRGALGRTPTIWDLNVRMTYTFRRVSNSIFQPRLILDILHLGSERETVNVDQIHFNDIDANGNQTGENPNFLQPIGFQPPMTVRLGFEVSF